MLKSDVKIGGVYAVKVSHNVVPVRIERAILAGGWLGRNLVTMREIHIKSVQRLRYEMKRREFKRPGH